MRFIRSVALSALVVAVSLLVQPKAFAQTHLGSCQAQVASEVSYYLREVAGLSEETTLELFSVKQVAAGATAHGDWNESYKVELKIDGFPHTYIAKLDANCSVLALEKPAKPSLFKAKFNPGICETYEPDCDAL